MPDQPNPYQAPNSSCVPGDVDVGEIPQRDLKKIQGIVNEAGQFWLAIILCLFCSGLGMIAIGPWYGIRLFQWYSMSKQHPQLLAPGHPPGSLPKRFQSAQWKLWVGLSAGLLTAMSIACMNLMAFGWPL